MRIIYLCGLVCFLLFGCQSKYERLMYGGKVESNDFLEEIPFEFSRGLPIIGVEIQGNTYRFLFDTGAPNVISKELAERIEYEKVSSTQMNDSQGGRAKQLSVRVDKINIGDVVFSDMGAIIIDYNKVFELSCFEIDGIIGSNLMAKLFWEINYEDKVLRFTDKKENFDIPDDAFTIQMGLRYAQLKPIVEIKVDQINFKRVTFDTGASGAFGLVSKGAAKTVVDSLAVLEMRGSNSVGVYGDGGDSRIQYAMIDTIRMGSLKLYDQLVEFEDKGSMTLGNRFLKNYRVILDWEARLIHLIQREEFSNREMENFGFYLKVRTGKVYVGTLILGSVAEEKGIALGQQILQINELDLRSVEGELACELGRKLREMDEIEMTVLDGEEEKVVKLVKEDQVRRP